MTWRLTGSLDEFLDAAGDHLRSDPVRNTVPLTVLGALQQRGLAAFGEKPPSFGWHEMSKGTASGVDGAFFQTPPFAMWLAELPMGSAGALVESLRAVAALPAAVNVPAEAAADFATAWTATTGGTATRSLRSRLHRLAGLVLPEPAPAGAVRTASRDDRGLLVRWHDDFAREAESAAAENSESIVDDRLSHGGLRLWEVEGEPVAMAALPAQSTASCESLVSTRHPRTGGRAMAGVSRPQRARQRWTPAPPMLSCTPILPIRRAMPSMRG